jgi:PAS domain S-box-containing protein
MSLAAFQAIGPQWLWLIVTISAIVFLAFASLVIYFVRRLLLGQREPLDEATAPRVEDSAAFMTASIQGVIKKLQEQEKELERLHRIEKERAEHTERLSEEVTRNMPAGLLVVNAVGIISSANPAAEQVLGVRGLGFRRYSEALEPSSELTRLLGQCLAHGTISRREVVSHSTPSGEIRRLGVTISPIRRGDETVSGAICLLTDLTELAALQKQVELKKNLAALGELSAGIAHEFKNALATISGYTQMIRAETSQGEIGDYAEHILQQTRSITHVVTEFLKYARPLEISDEAVPLRVLIDRVIAEVTEAVPGVAIRREGQFGSVAGDEGLLRQALLNLTRNAAEASASERIGGSVLLRGEVSSDTGSPVQRVTIVDDGPGISDSAKANLFIPFFTTKPNGTGLGLAVVQKIVVQHGGQVEATNSLGGGAAFILTLPVWHGGQESVDWKQSIAQP